uniref:Uncharacterized protein n=1 Tax=Setaria italica TaxID=4555 RepID=K3Y0I2_SETIT
MAHQRCKSGHYFITNLHRDLQELRFFHINQKSKKRKKKKGKYRLSKNLLSSGLQIVLPHCNFRRTKVFLHHHRRTVYPS